MSWNLRFLDTPDVIAGELRFTIHCGGHGCEDSPRLHSGQYYGYGRTQMDVQTKILVLTITLATIKTGG